MNGDGDILGTRRRLEPTSGDGSSLSSLIPGSAASSPMKRQGSVGVLSPGGLKRQRSVGGLSGRGGGGGGVGGESEKKVEGPAGDVPVDQLTPEQLRRFQAWKRSRLERGCIREIILDRAAPTLVRALEAGQGSGSLNQMSTMVVASVAKMFVGDLIEEAKRAQLDRGEEGPLRPKDLLEARESLARDGRGPPLRPSSSRERGLGVESGGGGGSGKGLLGGGAVLVKGNAI